MPVRYWLAGCLFGLSAVAYLDRTNISIAGVEIGREFGIDHTHLGWVFSAFLVGYTVFQIPAGLLAGRLGPRRVLTLGLGWWAATTALTAVLPARVSGGLLLLMAVRFALGAGEAVMYPAASQFVERWFPVEERGRANGLIFAGVGVGSGLTPPLVTAIVLREGWRASFWFSAGLGLVAAGVWWLVARDAPEQHPRVEAGELAAIVRGRGEAAVEGGRRAIPWRRLFASREAVALTASYFCFGYVAWIFFAWFYIYLADVRGLNLKASALYSTLPFVGMTIGCLAGGVASDRLVGRYGRRVGRCVLPAVAMAVTSGLMVAGSRAERAETASVVLACGAGVLYVAQSCFWAVSTEFGGEYTGVVGGLMNMGAQAGGAVTASLTPLIAARYGWGMSFYVAAGLSLLGGGAWLAVGRGGLSGAQDGAEVVRSPAGG